MPETHSGGNPLPSLRDGSLLSVGGRRLVAQALVVVAGAMLIAGGLGGAGRGSDRWVDFRWLHRAGECWLTGQSPYDEAKFLEAGARRGENLGVGFAYPPHAAPVCMPLALLEFDHAAWVWTLINLAALASLVAWSVRTTRSALGPTPCAHLVVASTVLVSPFASHVVWMGQTSLVVTACLVHAWDFTNRYGRPALGGACLAIACIKPNLALPVLLWLVLERHWRTLGWAVAVGLLAAAYPMWLTGPLAAVREWLGAVERYRLHSHALLGDPHVIGLEPLLFTLRLPTMSFLVPSLLGVGALFWHRRKLPQDAQLATLCATAVLCLFSHDYDLVMAVPLCAALGPYAATSGRRACLAVGALILLYLPSRIVRSLGAPWLQQWRTAVLLAALAWLVALALRNRRSTTATTTGSM